MRESYKYRKSSFTNKNKREGASLHKVNTWLAHSSIFFRQHLPPTHKFNIHLCVCGEGTECHSLHVARGELVSVAFLCLDVLYLEYKFGWCHAGRDTRENPF